MEVSTRQRYTYCLNRHIMPEFGRMPMIDILPEHVRECVAGQKGVVETDIESGLRWGELTELRAGDLDIPSRMLTVSRAVVQVQPRHSKPSQEVGQDRGEVVVDQERHAECRSGNSRSRTASAAGAAALRSHTSTSTRARSDDNRT